MFNDIPLHIHVEHTVADMSKLATLIEKSKTDDSYETKYLLKNAQQEVLVGLELTLTAIQRELEGKKTKKHFWNR